jgi:hypothetical protein
MGGRANATLLGSCEQWSFGGGLLRHLDARLSNDRTTHESTITFGDGNDVIVRSEHALTTQDFIFLT